MQQPETRCPFCQADPNVHEYLLEETDSFRVAADQHPLTEGHILIIPRDHISCVGEYDDVLMEEFLRLYKKVQDFVQANYGALATFEHGRLGQSVFHSHVHILSFNGSADEIIPEGDSHLTPVGGIKDMQTFFEKQGSSRGVEDLLETCL